MNKKVSKQKINTHEVSPKTAAILIAVVAIVALGIGYKFFFARSAPADVVVKPGYERFAHPSGPDNMLPNVSPSVFQQGGQQQMTPPGGPGGMK